MLREELLNRRALRRRWIAAAAEGKIQMHRACEDLEDNSGTGTLAGMSSRVSIPFQETKTQS
jgi:hypothetical protein